MKRLLPLLALLSLALPAVAVGAAASPDDGTLSIRNADGMVAIRATGGFIGRFDRGTITVTDPNPDDGTGPIVSGAERGPRDVTDTKTVWSGTDVRFRMIGGKFRVVIRATGIDLSVVGRGLVWLDGHGDGPDGRYSFDGAPYSSMPDLLTEFELGTPTGP